MNALNENGLNNSPENKVKIIFYPAYLSPNDGLLAMKYNDFVAGTSIGIFPSRYEPWGYTPFESAAMQVVSVTTDVAGFGKFILDNSGNKESPIKVLRLTEKSDDEVSKDLADMIEEYVEMKPEKRQILKIKTRSQVESLDWKYQVENYVQAHNLALKNMKKRSSKK